jgi:hypothetical protein
VRSFKSSILINATPQQVWEVLVDTEKWPEWDPTCEKIEGRVGLGNKLRAFSKLSPERGFAVKVSELDEPSLMVWRGGMPFGLFTGERTFQLLTRGEQTDFSLREVFRGPMLALIGRSLPDLGDAFDQFCQGLKARVEAA